MVNNAIIQFSPVWSFFTAHMVPAIRKYQMGSQLQDEEEAREVGGLTAEQFEDYLIFAVSHDALNVVSVNITHNI